MTAFLSYHLTHLILSSHILSPLLLKVMMSLVILLSMSENSLLSENLLILFNPLVFSNYVKNVDMSMSGVKKREREQARIAWWRWSESVGWKEFSNNISLFSLLILKHFFLCWNVKKFFLIAWTAMNMAGKCWSIRM